MINAPVWPIAGLELPVFVRHLGTNPFVRPSNSTITCDTAGHYESRIRASVDDADTLSLEQGKGQGSTASLRMSEFATLITNLRGAVVAWNEPANSGK